MKNRMIAVCSAVLFILALGVIAQAQAPAKVAGTWTMSYMGRGGQVMATLMLMQDGATLKGSLKNPNGMEAPLDGGTVSGNDITFSVTRQGRDGNPVKVEYKATVTGDAMKGTFAQGDRSIDWTATR